MGHFSNLKTKYNVSVHNQNILVLPRIKLKSKWHCSIKVRKELIFSGLLRRNIKERNSLKKLALLIPTKNFGDNVKDSVLYKYLIPNLKKTITLKDLEIINEITLYVGYDFDDLLHKIVNQKYIINILPKYLKIKFFELPRTNWVTFIWNFLFVESVNDKNDYFLQINDDIKFLSESWISSIISKIGLNEIGVIGLNDIVWNCKLYTQSLVNINHYEIFNGQYFPLDLANWFSDDWLTLVYQKHGGKCDNNTLVQNSQIKRRYVYCDGRNLNNSLKTGLEIINKYKK